MMGDVQDNGLHSLSRPHVGRSQIPALQASVITFRIEPGTGGWLEAGWGLLRRNVRIPLGLL
jgi:hypothetical protein